MFHWKIAYAKGLNKITPKQSKKKEEKKKIIESDIKFYEEIWKERGHGCYECGKRILFPKISNFHHIIPKQLQWKFNIDIRHNKENIVILCVECHNQVETDITKTPKVFELTKEIKDKYEGL